MLSRAFLELVARSVNIDPSATPNDSKLEQKVIYALKNTAGDAVKATQTLTSDTTNVDEGDTVTIGGLVYTFKATPNTPFSVDIGASAAVSLDNLKAAINDSGTEGTTYGTGTYAHPDVTATTNTDTTQVVEAINTGTEANAIATTETSAHLSWGAATLAGGAAGTYYKGETTRSEAQVSGGANI